MAAETKRGCGYRKIGGLYLCADGPGETCHRLPIPLEVCPICHAGIKQTRGWTWVKPDLLGGLCVKMSGPIWRGPCAACPVCTPRFLGDKAGLIWIGERFYKTPENFTREAEKMGVSRRIAAIPKGFRVGEHWVLVAHPKAVRLAGNEPCDCLTPDGDGQHLEGCTVYRDQFKPGIFHVFKPSRIEKILADNASAEEIAEWEKKGCKVVLLPTDDKNHTGSVYDDDEERSILDLERKKQKCI